MGFSLNSDYGCEDLDSMAFKPLRRTLIIRGGTDRATDLVSLLPRVDDVSQGYGGDGDPY